MWIRIRNTGFSSSLLLTRLYRFGKPLGSGSAELWIRIHVLRIRIQLFFSMQFRIQFRFRIQQLFKCGSGFSQTKFVKNYLEKKVAQNFFKKWSLSIFTYLIFYNKITISTNLLALFLFFFPQTFPSWIRIQEGK